MPMSIPASAVLCRIATVVGLAAAGAVAFGQSPPLALPPAAVAGTSAGPVRRLTLDEARQLALGNKALVLGRLNVEQLQHATDAARKDYFPKVLGNVSYFHFDGDLGEVVTVQRGQRGILPPGIATINVAVVNQNAALSTVMVAQPITKLIAVNALVQIARAEANAAQAQLDKGTRDLLSGVAQAYYGLLGAQRIQTALELQVQLLEQLVSAKPAPELRIGLVETKQGLAQVRGQVLELTQQLNSLLDFPLCTVLELVDSTPYDPSVRCADEAAEIAVAHDPEIREAAQSIAKAEAGLRVARMGYLPDVNVVGGYANQTGADYIQDNIGFVGVTAGMTLWEWNKKKDLIHQRQTQIALAQQNVAVTADKVRLAARKAYLDFDQAREAYRLAGEMVQARTDAEKSASGPAAAQAKADTTKAQLELMKAEIAYRVAHAQLAGLVCGQ
jgi:outer membrane protein TolC